jgi:hypothetical protein
MIKVYILILSAMMNTATGPVGHSEMRTEDSYAVCMEDAEKFKKQETKDIAIDAQCITVTFKAPAKPTI